MFIYNLTISNESLDIKNFTNIVTKFQEKAKGLGLTQNSGNNTTVSSNQKKTKLLKKLMQAMAMDPYDLARNT